MLMEFIGVLFDKFIAVERNTELTKIELQTIRAIRAVYFVMNEAIMAPRLSKAYRHSHAKVMATNYFAHSIRWREMFV